MSSYLLFRDFAFGFEKLSSFRQGSSVTKWVWIVSFWSLWLLNGMVSFRYTKLPDGIFDAGESSPPNSWSGAIFRKRSSATLHQEGCNVHKNHWWKTRCCRWNNSCDWILSFFQKSSYFCSSVQNLGRLHQWEFSPNTVLLIVYPGLILINGLAETWMAWS